MVNKGFIHFRFKDEFLVAHGLPAIGYPIPSGGLEEILDDGASASFDYLLYGLQAYSSFLSDGWEEFEPAMKRLAELTAPGDCPDIMRISGENWAMELGPVDLDDKIVTVQRKDYLVAAIGPRKGGILRISVYRPPDARAIKFMLGLSLIPDSETGMVCMRPNNWEYALDQSCRIGSFYAKAGGGSYLSIWERGLGIANDGNAVPDYIGQRKLTPLPIPLVIAHLEAFCRNCPETTAP